MSAEPVLIPTGDALPITIIPEADYANWAAAQDETTRAQLAAQRFEGKRYSQALRYGGDGRLAGAVVGVRGSDDVWALGNAAFGLPARDFVLDTALPADTRHRLALGFALGAYQFLRYKPKAARTPARLVVADETIRTSLLRLAAAVYAARDLVNTPTEQLGPEQLERVVAALATRHGAGFRSITGEALLAHNFPAIHAVGRASHRPPRLLELNWGDPGHPRVAILGKGVCFDTGGLDIKPAEGMALMKKDMGGAAVAISLAGLVMAEKLPVHLQLLVPAVENAIGPDAYRPGEVISTRAGLSVEIGNTDAEGRVILCDALAYACESDPELLLDFATLTGAARIALGPDLPALFANREELSLALIAAGRKSGDPLWAMPLWEDYQSLIDSGIADLNNAGSSRMAGCITAALYLKRFVPGRIPWAHLDTYCWSEGKPGRPAGGDCHGLRAAYAYLRERYGN
ncbi:MAG: leucyl aminopeptidase family protein [Xanthomonadales bacterium]|nr:cytosol aminopeptidase [Xanthomonadales bacterium]MCC6592635.1 leucyl aminopeptidase family protein [Xanthomonadales bacterium]MCE7931776.1 leucyl aminopeptidase family protein [Xanthomonadales bacterium PRO6]